MEVMLLYLRIRKATVTASRKVNSRREEELRSYTVLVKAGGEAGVTMVAVRLANAGQIRQTFGIVDQLYLTDSYVCVRSY